MDYKSLESQLSNFLKKKMNNLKSGMIIKKQDVILKKYLIKKLFSNPRFNNLSNYKKIFVTPGISLRLEKFKNLDKSRISRDLNLYISNIKKQKIIAVTGTNGKSTTTKLIGDILKKNKKRHSLEET